METKKFLSSLPLDELTSNQYQELVDYIESRKDTTRNEVASELQKYRDDLLSSRGIKSPGWIGKNELQVFIDGLRGGSANERLRPEFVQAMCPEMGCRRMSFVHVDYELRYVDNFARNKFIKSVTSNLIGKLKGEHDKGLHE